MKYVIGIVYDSSLGFVVGITKKKGPSFLINKLTFPGGKLEEGETPEQAISREMQEETGLAIPVENWTMYDIFETDEYILYKLVSASNKVFYARQVEVEPVWQLAISQHLKYASAQPEKYAPDFIKTLEDALNAEKVLALVEAF